MLRHSSTSHSEHFATERSLESNMKSLSTRETIHPSLLSVALGNMCKILKIQGNQIFASSVAATIFRLFNALLETTIMQITVKNF